MSSEADLSKFKALAAEIAEDGFRYFVLLGMGHTALCSDLFIHTFGKQPNAPEALVLDSTEPAQVKALRAKIDPGRTLFCVTDEADLLLPYFFEETQRNGAHFIAVTKPGSTLEQTARQLGFREVFQEDGYLVPLAAMGLDTELFLKRIAEQKPDAKLNSLLQIPGRDKVMLICSKSIQKLGACLEQMMTGPLIPVDQEPVLAPESYGKDRVFVYIRLSSDKDAELEGKVNALESAGEPVARLLLKDFYDLGQILSQWQAAVTSLG